MIEAGPIQAVCRAVTSTAAGVSDRLLARALRLRNNGTAQRAWKSEAVLCPGIQALMSVVDYHECVWPEPKQRDD